MTTPDLLHQLKRFDIPGRIKVAPGKGGLPMIELATSCNSADIYLQGAQVTKFQLSNEPQVLFMSRCSQFREDRVIRGGIPIIFPWFGPKTGSSAHGFARLQKWEVQEANIIPGGGVSVRLALPRIPHPAEWSQLVAHYAISLSDALTLELIITNTSSERSVTFENCLHSYFSVGNIDDVSVRGLKGKEYVDKTDSFAIKSESEEAILVTSEVDRVYLDTQDAVDIVDSSLSRRIRIVKSGSASTVLWNPWSAKSRQMTDFADQEFKYMVCVESGNIARNRVMLRPGASSVLKARISSHSR